MARQSTRRLGTATRIYKNVAEEVVAIDSIEVVANELRVGTIIRFSVDKINVSRTILHLSTGANRTVDSIQMIGSYTSVEENGGDFLILKWDIGTEDTEEVVISIESKVAKIGDTV